MNQKKSHNRKSGKKKGKSKSQHRLVACSLPLSLPLCSETPASLSLLSCLLPLSPSALNILQRLLCPPSNSLSLKKKKKKPCGRSPPESPTLARPPTRSRWPRSRFRTCCTPRSGCTPRYGGGPSAAGPCPCSSGLLSPARVSRHDDRRQKEERAVVAIRFFSLLSRRRRALARHRFAFRQSQTMKARRGLACHTKTKQKNTSNERGRGPIRDEQKRD
jgi:hypothetical protein